MHVLISGADQTPCKIIVPDDLRFVDLGLKCTAGLGIEYSAAPLQQIWDASSINQDATSIGSVANAALIVAWYFAAVAAGQPRDEDAEKIVQSSLDNPILKGTREHLARGCHLAIWQAANRISSPNPGHH